MTPFLENKLYIALSVLTVLLLVFIAIHQLSRKRARKVLRVSARASFKQTVSAVADKVPAATEYWENKIVDDMPYVSKILNHAVVQLSSFLSSEERSRLEKEWLSTKSFIEKKLSDDLLAAGMLYGSTPATARSAKEEFHHRIQSLLKYSDETKRR